MEVWELSGEQASSLHVNDDTLHSHPDLGQAAEIERERRRETETEKKDYADLDVTEAQPGHVK